MRAGVALPPLLMPASPTLVAVGLKRALSLSPEGSGDLIQRPFGATGLPPLATRHAREYSRRDVHDEGKPMRDHRSPAEVIREWRLPRAEREAAASERRAERELRRERDNEETAARRAAALEAEARKGSGGVGRRRLSRASVLVAHGL
jgi:hypothetical protein